MKNNDSFDDSFFIKLICIIAAVILVIVVGVALSSVLTKEKSDVRTDDPEAETFVFGQTENADADETRSEKAEDTQESEPVVNETESESETEAEPETEPQETAPVNTVLSETPDAGEEYIGKIIFVGDSTTYGLKAYKMLDGGKSTKQVWTSSSASLSLNNVLTKKIIYPETGKEMTIPEAAELAKPEYMVITLGLEGVTSLDENGFRAEYTSLVEAVRNASPETKIMLQSIYPVASSFTEKDKLNNPLIDRANEWVKDIAEQNGVRYLDTQSVMKTDGALNPKYDNGGNGINLNDTGFKVVLDYIRTHAYN